MRGSARDPDHLRRGRESEQQALRFLERKGMRCIERNFRTRHGELDLIMNERGTLVFVEVRYRHDGRFGGALASIDASKQRRLLTAARQYLAVSQFEGPVRFDVVTIQLDRNGQSSLDWIRDAIRED